MPKRGTDIYYISGPGKQSEKMEIVQAYIGSPKYYAGVSADDTPIIDYGLNLGWHDYWDKQTYIDWFNANVVAYGVATAISKMKAAAQSWGNINVGELDYGCDPSWVSFFVSQGMSATDIQTPQCAVAATGQKIISDASQGLQKTANILSELMPVAVIGLGVWGISKLMPEKKSKVSGSSDNNDTLLVFALTGGLLYFMYSKNKDASATQSDAGQMPDWYAQWLGYAQGQFGVGSHVATEPDANGHYIVTNPSGGNVGYFDSQGTFTNTSTGTVTHSAAANQVSYIDPATNQTVVFDYSGSTQSGG